MKIHVQIWDNKYSKYRKEIITDTDLETIVKIKIKEWVDVSEEELDNFEINNIEI